MGIMQHIVVCIFVICILTNTFIYSFPYSYGREYKEGINKNYETQDGVYKKLGKNYILHKCNNVGTDISR